MGQWWVKRSNNAAVICTSPNTLAHSPELRLVVITTLVLSQSLESRGRAVPLGSAEGQVAQFVEHDHVEMHQPMRDLTWISTGLFLPERINQLDRREEPNPSVMVLDGLYSQRRRDGGLAGFRPTDQHDVLCVL